MGTAGWAQCAHAVQAKPLVGSTSASIAATAAPPPPPPPPPPQQQQHPGRCCPCLPVPVEAAVAGGAVAEAAVVDLSGGTCVRCLVSLGQEGSTWPVQARGGCWANRGKSGRLQRLKFGRLRQRRFVRLCDARRRPAEQGAPCGCSTHRAGLAAASGFVVGVAVGAGGAGRGVGAVAVAAEMCKGRHDQTS